MERPIFGVSVFAVIKTIDDPLIFKSKTLQWASSFDTFCYLDSNAFTDPYSKFDALIAIGAKDEIVTRAGNAFDKLEKFRRKYPGWIAGFFGYDLKNETEQLSSNNGDCLNFPDLYFFVPQYLILIKGNVVEIIADDLQAVLAAIESQSPHRPSEQLPVTIKSGFSKTEYLETVAKIKEHIARGDIYVTNFCQEFYAENAEIDPLSIFTKLNTASPAPFSAFLKWNDNYALCA